MKHLRTNLLDEATYLDTYSPSHSPTTNHVVISKIHTFCILWNQVYALLAQSAPSTHPPCYSYHSQQSVNAKCTRLLSVYFNLTVSLSSFHNFCRALLAPPQLHFLFPITCKHLMHSQPTFINFVQIVR